MKKTHRIRSQQNSQAAIIGEYLRAHAGLPVPAPLLANITGSLAVHSRIADLRLKGLKIVNKCYRELREGLWETHSFYTYFPDAQDGPQDQQAREVA